MDEEKQRRHLAMMLGHIGLLLFGLAMMRFMEEFDDTLGQGLVLFGILFLGPYLKFLEKRAGVTKMEANIFSGLLVLGITISGILILF
ncbi:hypothetical protein [Salinibacillus xinjiangensis]|uniref:DUF3953 domain-containing protein n=1 Tax=Salinibacillus xinjiangensis TaxID=1229268 RepID=A0A6G1X492_9BACI|nr:hypothetical protein [Salinibacillus xinjiangensis]MRG85762.1 hypothetical protein [Salinibacillus xinjiangensis]